MPLQSLSALVAQSRACGGLFGAHVPHAAPVVLATQVCVPALQVPASPDRQARLLPAALVPSHLQLAS
jgi:hypothetical protein